MRNALIGTAIVSLAFATVAQADPPHPNFSDAGSIGWHYGHPRYCFFDFNGDDTPVLYVFFEERTSYTEKEGTHIQAFGSHNFILIAPACQSGNWLSYYTYDTYGHWNRVTTWPYK
jgi:hypothetical protein